MRSYNLIGGTLLAALLVTTSLHGVASAQTQPPSISIVSQDLGAALLALGRQTGRDVLFTSDIVAGKRSAPVTGAVSFEQALQKLLEGTGLQFAIGSDGSATLGQRGSAIPAPVRPAMAPQRPVTPAAEELTVVGSRLSRSVDGPAPVTVLNRQRIDELGVTSIGDALKYVPQQSFNNGGTTGPGNQAVQLRGLAVGSTLVLVNGRRTVPGAVTVVNAFFDLNSIPLAAVERIEILADSASAVYGADAVGGVVNIVLKSKIENPVVDAYYGSSQGGGAERRGSLSLGGQTDRAQGLAIFDYFKRDALFGSERDIIANADYRRFGGIDRRALTTNPGNICAVSGNLPGLSTPCAAVPAGSTGIGLTPASFLATAGQRNLGTAAIEDSFVTPAENYGVMASGSYEISASVSAFAEVMYADRINRSITDQNLNNVVVPTANPFNPFGVPVLASFLIAGQPAVNRFHERSYREVAGLKGKLWSWDWELSFAGAQSIEDGQVTGYFDRATAAAALAVTSPVQALNVFRDGSSGGAMFPQSAFTTIDNPRNTSHVYQFGGFVRGDVVRLPAGQVQLVVGGEWRNENLSYVAKTFALVVPEDAAKRSAYAGYAETRIPILSDSMGVPLVHDFAVTVAGRYDHYSDFGSTFNAQYGAEWRPVPSLLIRGSRGDSYRAPSLISLYQPINFSGSINVVDPRRGNEAILVSTLAGGNPGLAPETSTSFSFGGVWMPEITGRPRLGASFWHIKQNNRLLGPTAPAVLLANEDFVPAGMITRAAPTAADIAAGRPGQLIRIDRRSLNLGRLDTSGLDLEATADFETDFGRLSPRLAATRVGKYVSQDFPTTPAVARVGIANVSGSVPKWKSVMSLTWGQGGVSITGTVRHISSYADATTANLQNGLRVKSQTLVDLQTAVDLADVLGQRAGVATGVTMRVGVTNLFNLEPRYSQVGSYGFDPSQADIRQRFLYVALSKAF